VWPGDLAPDDADLGALDGLLSTVDICEAVNPPFHCARSGSSVRTGYALATVPVCRLGAVNALELQQRSAGVGVALSSLVAVVVSDTGIACRGGACSRNVLSLDIEAVGLLRHGERFASG